MAGIEKSKSTIEKELKHLRKISEAIHFQEKLQELEANCKLATEAYQEYAGLKRQANQIRIDAKKVKMLQQAFRDKEQALMALQACATSLVFNLKPESRNIIQINGLALSDPGQELQIVDETHLELKDIGTIRITPGITDKRTLTEALTKAENAFNELLDESEIKTLEEAENTLQNKMSLSSQADSKLKESQIYAPGDAKLGLLPGAAELEQYIKTLKEDQDTRLSELGLECLPSRENVSNALQETEERAEKYASEYNRLKANLAGQEVVWDEAKKALVKQQSILDHAEKNADRLKLQLENAENKAPKSSIQEHIEGTIQKIKDENTKLEQHKLKQGQDTIELIEARISRLEEQLTNRRARINQLNVDISGLQNRVQVLEAEGLEENIALAEKQEEKLIQERSKFEREVKVLKLLQNTLSEAEAEARERYLAPVVNKIRPHLQVLFPRSTVEIDEVFKITGIVRDGDTLESFDHLSLGTKEQIAILVRLAFAEMLIEQGKPATLILDDALVFSDDERISLMFDILNLAARKMQVIVFTCRQKVFESLGGTQITIKPETHALAIDPNNLCC
jgi:DNA repair exonuclease SbcCD ATPase subunit